MRRVPLVLVVLAASALGGCARWYDRNAQLGSDPVLWFLGGAPTEVQLDWLERNERQITGDARLGLRWLMRQLELRKAEAYRVLRPGQTPPPLSWKKRDSASKKPCGTWGAFPRCRRLNLIISKR